MADREERKNKRKSNVEQQDVQQQVAFLRGQMEEMQQEMKRLKGEQDEQKEQKEQASVNVHTHFSIRFS